MDTNKPRQEPDISASNILIVKTSSLGDVIHALPAVSDIRLAGAAGRVDWVVEESLVAVPRLHAGVSEVIAVAVRRWRSAPWRRDVRAEFRAWRRQMREREYDAVIDAQGLFKSALIAMAARGPRYGLDLRSSREPLALFYDKSFRISWQLHAVERNRLLVARALGYEVPRHCDYGISAVPRRFDWLEGGAYAVLLHLTSGDYKLWREPNWFALASALYSAGIRCVLPWGNALERARAERLAAGLPEAVIAPALGLDELAGLFAGAKVVVGVDTGLTHLSAALGVPTVGLYCATDPAATGIHGCPRAVNLGGIGKPPEVHDVMSALERLT